MADRSKRYFRVLSLPENASPEEILQRYKDLVRVWHPDRFQNDSHLRLVAEERLKEINEAFAALKGRCGATEQAARPAGARSSTAAPGTTATAPGSSASQHARYETHAETRHQSGPTERDRWRRRRMSLVPRRFAASAATVAAAIVASGLFIGGAEDFFRRLKPPVERLVSLGGTGTAGLGRGGSVSALPDVGASIGDLVRRIVPEGEPARASSPRPSEPAPERVETPKRQRQARGGYAGPPRPLTVRI